MRNLALARLQVHITETLKEFYRGPDVWALHHPDGLSFSLAMLVRLAQAQGMQALIRDCNSDLSGPLSREMARLADVERYLQRVEVLPSQQGVV